MKTKSRSDSIRKRKNIEEKYSWDRLSDSDYERKSHKVRALIATVVVISLFLLYMVKLYQVQVSSHEYYTVKSDSNRIKIRPIQATRGIIYDRKGNILADNISTFNLIVKKEMIGNKKDFLDGIKWCFKEIKDKNNKLGLEARINVEKNFSNEFVSKKYVKLYEDFLTK
mgnify:CR=1 FL=1